MENKKEVPQEVKESDYGCPNCLWYGVECKNGERYVPASGEIKRKSPCDGYIYYD